MPVAGGGAPNFSGSRLDVATAAVGTLSIGGATPLSNGITLGSGDNVPYYVNATAWLNDERQGTTAAPILTGSGPTLKISRTESIPETTMPSGIGANNQGNAGLWVAAIGDAANQVQVSAILGTTTTSSTQNTHNDDACAVQGMASVTGSGTGSAIGAYFQGRRDTDTGNANGIEVRSWNQTGTAGAYNTAGFSNTVGVWATASGTANSGVAFSTGAFSGQAWLYGIGFTAGSVATAAFSDDSSATDSILINGTHTHAVGVKAGAGAIAVGHTNSTDALTNATAVIEAFSTAAATPLMAVQGGTNASVSLKVGNSNGSGQLFSVGTAGNFLTGTAAGDAGFVISTSGKAFHLGGTTKVISVMNANTLGFFAATPVAQQTRPVVLADVINLLVAFGLSA